MKFLFESDTWEEIYESIRKNKLRTIITITGVTWGVFLLVALLGSAKGMENKFNNIFGDFATNSVFIWGQNTSIPFKGFQKNKAVTLKMGDVNLIQNEIKDIEFVVPRNRKRGIITNNFLSGSFFISGDFPLLDKVQKTKLTFGRFINEKDIQEKRKIILISEDVYKQLFKKDVEAIGENVLINQINFKVVGIFKVDNFGPSSDVYIPFTTFQQIFNTGEKIGWMMVTGKKNANIAQIEKDAKLLLKNVHKVHPKDKRALGSYNLGKEIAKTTNFLTGMQFLTWFVGIATLIAGTFAIGNILLITVKERTKEIGIRRALGATPLNIKRQIVLEAVSISLLAGVFGIISGGLVLIFMDKLWGQGEDSVILNPSVSIPIVLVAIIILTVFGTLIGLIPANRAVKIKPIEALSSE